MEYQKFSEILLASEPCATYEGILQEKWNKIKKNWKSRSNLGDFFYLARERVGARKYDNIGRKKGGIFSNYRKNELYQSKNSIEKFEFFLKKGN